MVEQTSIFTPGEFYTVMGRDPIRHSAEDIDQFHPAMYVRDEKISRSGWQGHVFAALTKQGGILLRVKVPLCRFDIVGRFVTSQGNLDTPSVICPRDERAESVNTFIDVAYSLCRKKGLHVTGRESDIYDLAAHMPEDERARLRLMIDHYHNRDSS